MRAYQFLEWCGGLSFHPPSSPMKNWNENWKFYIGSRFNPVTCSTRSSHPPSTDFLLRSTFPPIPTKKRVAKKRIERETVSSSFHVCECVLLTLSSSAPVFSSSFSPSGIPSWMRIHPIGTQRIVNVLLATNQAKKQRRAFVFFYCCVGNYALFVGSWLLFSSLIPSSCFLHSLIPFLLFPFSISMPTSLFPPFPPRRYSFQYGSVMGGRERRWRWHRHKKEEEEEEGIDFSQRRIGHSRFDKYTFLWWNPAKLGGNVVCIKKCSKPCILGVSGRISWIFAYMVCTVHILPGQDLLQSSLAIFFFSWLTGVGAVRRPRSWRQSEDILSSKGEGEQKKRTYPHIKLTCAQWVRAWAWWSLFCQMNRKKIENTFLHIFCNLLTVVFMYLYL